MLITRNGLMLAGPQARKIAAQSQLLLRLAQPNTLLPGPAAVASTEASSPTTQVVLVPPRRGPQLVVNSRIS